MPANFPEVWENRVRHLIEADNSAPWLDGIPELNTQVIEMGSGDASEANIIHLPTTDFEVETLIDNTTYPIDVVEYDDDGVLIKLHKFQTKIVSIPDDQVIGAAYPIIDAATLKLRKSITDSKFAKAAHALAPAADTANTFVIEATGAVVGNRKKLLWADLVTARRRRGSKRVKNTGWRCVLCSDHVNDLLEDATNRNSEKLADYLSGQVAGKLAGFEMFEFDETAYYDTDLEKLPFGQVPISTDRQCSFIFHVENVVKKTGMTKQYYADAKILPTLQTNQLGYRHYFIAMPVRTRYAGAII